MRSPAWLDLPSGLHDDEDVLYGILLSNPSSVGSLTEVGPEVLAEADAEARRLQRASAELRGSLSQSAAVDGGPAHADSDSKAHEDSGEAEAASIDIALIKKTAKFCFDKRPDGLSKLRAKPSAMTVMPFLFEGRPGHAEFVEEMAAFQG